MRRGEVLGVDEKGASPYVFNVVHSLPVFSLLAYGVSA